MLKQSNAVNIFQSTFDGGWFRTQLPASLARSMLPPDFTIDSEHTHPAFFFFGDQLRGAFYVGSRLVSAPISYNEWGVIFPYVNFKGTSEKLSVISQMVCNYPIATSVGRQLYGYNKQSGLMRWDGNTYSVSRTRPIMEITISPPKGCRAQDVSLLQVLNEHRVVGVSVGGQLLFSRWELDLGVAETWKIGANFTLGIEKSKNNRVYCDSVSAEQGLMVRGLLWKVSFPFPY